jgi:hypothetical protein
MRQRWIETGEQSRLQTHIATTQSVSLCVPTENWPRLSSLNQRSALPFFELASVLVRFNHVARFIVNTNHGIM